jgi:hypothetical protein
MTISWVSSKSSESSILLQLERLGLCIKSWLSVPSNNLLQRSVNDKVLGRGRGRLVQAQVCGARVLERTRAVAEQKRYATTTW